MILDRNITDYFNDKLIRRTLPQNIYINEEDKEIIEKVGLPDNAMDFSFDIPPSIFEGKKLLLGKQIGSENVFIDLLTRKVLKGENKTFLAKNLKNFISQLFVFEQLWSTEIKNKTLGEYRENHEKYARLLEKRLLLVDDQLLLNDNGYFWGSYIEDIEFGIVG